MTVANQKSRVRKIALEEHFLIPEFEGYFTANKTTVSPDLYAKALTALQDIDGRRLELMDESGLDYVVLSISGPGVQDEPYADVAIKLARKANDYLADEISKNPDRFGGFAHLPMQDPKVAADELERCVRELGFQGGMINGATMGVYLDDRRYDVFWERVEAIDAPIYLHPNSPVDKPAMYHDHPEMWGPTLSWNFDTGAHALRLVFGGVFDRYPKARIILGHMGETLPILMWRLDSRYPVSNRVHEIQRKPSDYIKSNITLTTAGVCSDEALRCSLDAVGPESVMFSVDYPFESIPIACEWIESARLSDEERARVSSGNAEKILKLG